MIRTAWALLLGVILATGGSARAADKAAAAKAPAGTWKVTALAGERQLILWLIKLEQKGGKWTGSVVANSPPKAQTRLPPASAVGGVQVMGDVVRFKVKVQESDWTFEGQTTREKGIILGNILLPEDAGGQPIPARLEQTTLKKLDDLSLTRETLEKQPASYETFTAFLKLLRDPDARAIKSEQLKTWADRAYQGAGAYGVRWQRFVTQRLADALLGQEGHAELALDYARKAEKLMDPKADPDEEMRTLQVVVKALKKAKKDEEVKKYEGRLQKYEDKLYGQYLQKSLRFKTTPYKGRKSKSKRVVLVELFCSTQSAPSTAAELALLALGKTYKPSEVVLLEYHLQLPPPDVLSNPACKERLKYYFDDIEGTPAVFFNGKLGAPGGGTAFEAEDKYAQYRALINPLLEKPTPVKLTATALLKGHKIIITAEASGLEKPGPRVRLRLALVEDWIKYAGLNRVAYHLHVVRAMPGGADGRPLTGKASKPVTVDLSELRKDLNRYLVNYAKHSPFPDDQRPLDLRNLSVVAFVQNDETREVLQATQVKLGGEEKAEEKGKEKVKEKEGDKGKEKEKEKDE